MRRVSSTAYAGMDSWEFREGDAIGPGRHALRLLGGGHRFEAWLAWDERLRTLVVVKLLRPGEVDDPVARRGLAGEARLLGRLAHPLLVRSFSGSLAASAPNSCSSTSMAHGSPRSSANTD